MRFPLLLFMTLGACASATSGSPPQPSSEVVRVLSPSGTASMTLSASDGLAERKVAGSPEQVFKILPAALDSLGIPVNTLDASKHTIGNSGFSVRGKLKGVALSRYLDCGGATQIGPNADSYSINLQFIVEVRPADVGSALVTTLQAVGKPVNYAQDYSPCNSKGNLENRLSAIIAARLPH